MDRRQFLAMTLGIGTMALGAGCGGGSNGGGGALVSRAVPVALPDGFSLPLAELVVGTVWKSEALGAGASFSASVPAGDAPGLALLRHTPSGTAVLIGFVYEGTRGVTPLGSAVALLYYALGVCALPARRQREVLALIATHVATASLGETIARRVAASPFALSAGDAEIGAALRAARSAITGGGSRAVKLPTRQAAGDLAPVLSISPGEQSGARVDQGDDGQSVRIVNTKRRPLTVRVYRVAEDTGAGKVALPVPVEIGGPVDVPAVSGIASAIVDLATLQTPSAFWAPVSSAPIPLTLTTDSTRTYYESIVLMASGSNSSEPGFFTEGRYAGEVAKWRLDRGVLNSHAWVGGILADIVASIVGGVALALSTVAIDGILARFAAIEAAAEAQFLKDVNQGYFGSAIVTALKIAQKNSFVAENFRAELYEMVQTGEARIGAGVARAESAAMFEGACAVLLQVLAAAGLVALLADIGSTYGEIVASSKGERWEASLFKPTLVLSPRTQTIARGARVAFTATIPGAAPGQRFVFAWTKTGGANAFLSGPEPGQTGDTLETATGNVDLVTSPSTQGTITIAVVAYLVVGTTRTRIGTSSATITLSAGQSFTAGTTSGMKVFPNVFGGIRYHAWTAYTVPSVPRDWTRCEIRSGSYYGFLERSDYDRGVPAADPSDTSDFSTWQAYAPGSNVACFNLNGGIAFATYINPSSGFATFEEEDNIRIINLQIMAENPATVTFT
jgi:hypothetical protein